MFELNCFFIFAAAKMAYYKQKLGNWKSHKFLVRYFNFYLGLKTLLKQYLTITKRYITTVSRMKISVGFN